MVVWDLPAIQRGVQSLRTSRVATIYNTVAPSLKVFSTLFGKALQAQVRGWLSGVFGGWWPASKPPESPQHAAVPYSHLPRTVLLQARIAAVNTILTSLGMWALKIPGAGLLSLFVFCCGFIPIAGVIISTVPIGFVALTEYGFTKVGQAAVGGRVFACQLLAASACLPAAGPKCSQLASN